MIAPNAARLSNPNGKLRYLFMGRSKVNFLPESLIKAAIDPVKVTPPIKAPRYEATLWTVVTSTAWI